jgi:hypothetical protein
VVKKASNAAKHTRTHTGGLGKKSKKTNNYPEHTYKKQNHIRLNRALCFRSITGASARFADFKCIGKGVLPPVKLV